MRQGPDQGTLPCTGLTEVPLLCQGGPSMSTNGQLCKVKMPVVHTVLDVLTAAAAGEKSERNTRHNCFLISRVTSNPVAADVEGSPGAAGRA